MECSCVRVPAPAANPPVVWNGNDRVAAVAALSPRGWSDPVLQGDTRNLPLTGLFQTLEMGQEDGVLTVYFQRMERYFLLGTAP